ncbi:FtsX-like permease family protein [Candidatus Microgenomates bacterium]|nr:MAG: FtsX-like permease family protein [Candidatus Microgenomates bacterium]
MKTLLTIIKSSFEDIKRNKIRTFLTSLGILIGVLSVVLLMAFGFGLKAYIEKEFESLGKNLVMVLPGKGFQQGGQGLIGGVEFDEKDVLKLKRIKGVENLAPVFTKSIKIEANGKSEPSSLLASNGDLFNVVSLEIDKGKIFTNAQVEKKEKKVIIGATIAEKLFGSSDMALGKTVRIQNQRFMVSGVLKKKGGGALGSDSNTQSITPYKSVFSLNPNKKFFAIYIKTKNSESIEGLKSEIKKILLRRYKEDDFSVTEQAELLGTINSIFSILNSVLIAIGSISLLVGGIGIMNIMYATVTERIKEIGIRRAIGATKKDILLQFLSQATILSLFGGLIGLFIAFAIVLLIQPIFPAVINPLAVIIALGVSSAIGIFFGVFPANKAANLSPIEAIRYE